MRRVIMVVRHAPPVRDGICAGRFELPVQDFTARLPALAAELNQFDFQEVHTSPSDRCRRLASALVGHLGLPLNVDERLRELAFGQWEGRTWDAITRDDTERFEAWSRDWRVASPPGGECLKDLEMRVRGFFEAQDSRPMLLITHAGVIRSMRVIVQSISWQQAMSEPVPHLVPLLM